MFIFILGNIYQSRSIKWPISACYWFSPVSQSAMCQNCVRLCKWNNQIIPFQQEVDRCPVYPCSHGNVQNYLIIGDKNTNLNIAFIATKNFLNNSTESNFLQQNWRKMLTHSNQASEVLTRYVQYSQVLHHLFYYIIKVEKRT